MGEKEMRELITSVITETNSKNDELNTKIDMLLKEQRGKK